MFQAQREIAKNYDEKKFQQQQQNPNQLQQQQQQQQQAKQYNNNKQNNEKNPSISKAGSSSGIKSSSIESTTSNNNSQSKILSQTLPQLQSSQQQSNNQSNFVVSNQRSASDGSGLTSNIKTNKLSTQRTFINNNNNSKNTNNTNNGNFVNTSSSNEPISRINNRNDNKLMQKSNMSKEILDGNNSNVGAVGNNGASHQTRQRRQNSADKMQQQQKSCDNYYSSQSTMQSSRGGRGGSVAREKLNTRRNTRRNINRDIENSVNSLSSSSSSSSSCSGSCSGDEGDTSSTTSSGEPNLPYPGFPAVALKYLTQDTRPRNWCLMLITNPWFERISILVILLNCITLGMYQPCVDDACQSNRCKILQMFDDVIFAFFALEMCIKMVAMGIYGKDTYLADSWNRLDCFIVFAGLLEYVMHVENLNLTAIRTIRVLRPLRAINRIPSMRILVMLLLDTLPMLGNVLLLCFFVFFIFGIVGVQLWEGILRQRCVLDLPHNVIAPKDLTEEFRVRVRINSISFYYEFSKEQDYICSKPEDSGMHLCSNLPPYRHGPLECNATAQAFPSFNLPKGNSCVNWNQYYTNCTQLGSNPFQGTISFDNIGLAWVAIFLVISLEGWTDIMYYVQDAHSFWDWIYFVLLIVIGSFFMINLCLVVIATQFSETKKREMERMRQERARYTSTSTLASSTNNSEPATCYAEIVKYIAHLWRRFKRRLLKKYRLYKCQRQQTHEGLLPNAENLTFSPSRIKCHHPKCPKYNKKASNIQDQLITVMVPLNTNNNVQNSNQNLNLLSNNNNTTVVMANNNTSGNGNNSSSGVITVNLANNNNALANGHSSSPDNSELSLETISRSSNLKKNTNKDDSLGSQKTILLKIPTDSDQLINPCTSGFLSPPQSARRRSSVMFNEYVILHTPPTIPEPQPDKNVCSSEKMTQAGDGSIWQVNLPQTLGGHNLPNTFADCSELSLHDAMTCQELLAFSVAFSAALPTGQSTLESFYSSLTQHHQQNAGIDNNTTTNLIKSNSNYMEDYSCCYDLYQNALSPQEEEKSKKKSRASSTIITIYQVISKVVRFISKYVKIFVEHKYFQQGILLAILINTLSMGIEYHNQPDELTSFVETANIVFSIIFAIEMLLKVMAEGPFGYIANGFNVFDGIIVILSVIEICQTFWGDGNNKGSSGLSVLRTFRLLRILKLVRFMPNLRRQLFVMLRTMDNVAVFFSLLVLFIFIFSILGMYLFGGKFCKFTDDFTGQERECTCPEIINRHPHCECDRKHFNNFLWATVTVFQILTQEDWNVVLFNGMEKTSHWAALYFVALMTFGNYVLFNLLVAILVEGFSSERNERREREQRELVKKLREENMLAENFSDGIYDESRSGSDSSSTNESYYEVRNKWHSVEDFRKSNESQVPTGSSAEQQQQNDPKCNLQKQRLLQPSLDYQLNDTSGKKLSEKDLSKLNDEDKKTLKKTHSVKERRSDSNKLGNFKPLREPPIIMTTAATPQDSPSTTLESGQTFRNWNVTQVESIDDNEEQQVTHPTTLLKPPTLLSGQRILNVERLPSIDLIPPSPKMEHKSFNINNQQHLTLGSNTSISNLDINTSHSNSSSSSNNNICNTNNLVLPRTDTSRLTPISDNGHNSNNYNIGSGGINENVTAETIEDNTEQQQVSRSSSFKRFRRSSSKKKKKFNNDLDDETLILNNDRDSSQLSINNLTRNDSFLRSANRIQNDTKDTNKLSPQNSIRRLSVSSAGGGISRGSGTSRRSSCIYNNSQFYQNLNRHNSIKNYSSRRMSSIELALGKSSNLNIYNNMERKYSMAISNSKIDLEKWQKSLLSLNEEHKQQQKDYQQERKKSECISGQSDSEKQISINQLPEHKSKIKILIERLKPTQFVDERELYSLYIFPEDNRFRQMCSWFVNQKWFDNAVLLFIALNCITLAMERPNIPPYSTERVFLGTANYVFTVVFTLEMFIKVVAAGMFYGKDAYFTSGWNIMDGSLVIISIIDLLMSLISESSPKIFGILRVFRLLRSLRPLRVINRAPGLKLVVQTLLSSLRPIGNIVLICCTFFIIFGILGVQLFKGTFYFCEGEYIKGVKNKTDCLSRDGNTWVNRKYNFDDLGKALMSLFVLSSRDGWVNIMYTGLDAVGVDQQPIINYNEWRLLYFIAFILLVGFFVLNMFVGVVVENFHRCREEQEKEEKIRRAAKRALQMEKKRRRMHEPPYYTNYSPTRMFVHNVVTSKYFDLAIAAVIGLNVVTMAMEYYMMPVALEYALKIFNYFFTAVFILEAIMKLVALGWHLYLKDKWNQLDVGIVILSIVGIVLEELETNIIPINPTIIRVMRVLRIARVLKLLKMAKGIRALLDTVMQALPQVGNLGLLFFLLFFIFAALGVELFGRLDCVDHPCQGLGEHAHFENFGMAFLTLFRVATGDNWNGIMKDTLRDDCDDAADCVKNCCVSSVIAPIFFVIFVLMAQFVLVNVVVAVLMKHLEESHKQMEDELDMETELERELNMEREFEEDQALCLQLQIENSKTSLQKRPLEKVSSLPANFTYSTPTLDKKIFNQQRRQTVQYFNQTLGLTELGACVNSTSSCTKPSLPSMLSDRNSTSITEEIGENNFNEIMAAAAASSGRRLSRQELLLPMPSRFGGRGRRSSLLRARMLSREQSLDEHGVRKRRLEKKRMSCDNLEWGSPRHNKQRGTIFESTESENGPELDIRSTLSDDCTGVQKPMLHQKMRTASVDEQCLNLSSVSENKLTMPRERSDRKTFGRSQTIDQSQLAPTSRFLLVPSTTGRTLPPRSRSGSSKQLLKQQALDEDNDVDESSLLLPAITMPQIIEKSSSTGDTAPPEKYQDGLSKSDSAEILRIISERRQIDQKDSLGNEDSDYNELLLVKTPKSSND